MKKILIHGLIVLVLLLAGCSAESAIPLPPAGATQDPGAVKQALANLKQDALENYSSMFVVQFKGATNWKYELQTRKAGNQHEMSLHIEGVDKARNPGDVRFVTDGVTSWMIGPGTDNECVQFSNNTGMDPTWLYPESLVPAAGMGKLLSAAGEEKLLGRTTQRFGGQGLQSGPWKDAAVGVWKDADSGALMRFLMRASGDDPVFGAGSGKLEAEYAVDGLTAPAIEPVKGCEISVPLPEGATHYVRLPGMASFESAAAFADAARFYQEQLPQQGWEEAEQLTQTANAVVVSYKRGAEEVEIHAEANPKGGSTVKILFIQAK